ncbi:MAG TPA: hypothetical protein VGM90_38460 [Kofleriaceae bacterium]
MTLALVGCTDAAAIHTPDPLDSSAVEYKDIPLYMNASVDVLFVVDDSPAMAPYLAHLAAAARPLAQTITGGHVQPDVHIGVVTGDPADAGRLQGNRMLVDESRWNWQRVRNYDGTLPDNFAGLFDVGASGAATRSLFSAATRAVAQTTNAGFLRDNAYLVIVFVTAGDDASSIDVEATAAAIKALKPDPTRILVSAALGSDSPRLTALLDQFPNRSARVSLDDHDMTGLLALIDQAYRVNLGAPCIEGRLVEPYEIAASLVNPATGQEVLYPACGSGVDKHCWSIVDRPNGCPLTAEQKMLDIKQEEFTFPAHAIFNMVVEPGSG